MSKLRQTHAWRFFLSDPWKWVVRSFCQPAAFQQKTISMSLRTRIMLMLRICVVISLIVAPLAMLLRTLPEILAPSSYNDYFTNTYSLTDPGLVPFYVDGLWPVLLGCLLAGLFGALFSLRLGIAAAFGVSLAGGINNGDSNYVLVSIIFGLVLGLIVGPLFNNIRAIKKDSLPNVFVGNLTGVLTGLIVGTAVGIVGGFWSGVIVGFVGGEALQLNDHSLGSAAGLAISGIGSYLLYSFTSRWAHPLFTNQEETFDLSTAIGATVAGMIGVSVGTPCGDFGLLNGSTGFSSVLPIGISQSLLVSGFFLVPYLLNYLRLIPLYPINVYSMMRTYQKALGNPSRSLAYLQKSALHFDECVFLSLPFLINILRISAENNRNDTLQEIGFIVNDRPQQAHAAQIMAYEIALDDLEKRKWLEEISQAYTSLPRLLSPSVRRLNTARAKIFNSLEEISRDAASYERHNQNNDKRASYDALQRMLVGLHSIDTHTAFREEGLNRRLQNIVERWQSLAQQVQKTLNIEISDSYLITNPYTVGPTLVPLDGVPNPVFVGRMETVTRLHRALQKTPHPTFCLTGERRMGKSSILRQLPVLLGSAYIPIFCDLQNPAAHANIAVFFARLGQAIEEHLMAKHLPVEHLMSGVLEQAQANSEVAVYSEFDQWLKKIEYTLEEHNRTLLLMFDEFEKLEALQQKKLLDLDLLLSWFRSLSQNSTRVTLLFCGVKTIHNMGPAWTRHFVNVERIKVSFLQPADAHDLISRPVSAHSTRSIFDQKMVEEIIRVTNCHPFLLQALCSSLIDHLNDMKQDQADQHDIASAITDVLESWESYFSDQWDHSSPEQKSCLLALQRGYNQESQLIKRSGLESSTAYQVLNQLQERDLIREEQQMYEFAVPIFAQWLERNAKRLT